MDKNAKKLIEALQGFKDENKTGIVRDLSALIRRNYRGYKDVMQGVNEVMNPQRAAYAKAQQLPGGRHTPNVWTAGEVVQKKTAVEVIEPEPDKAELPEELADIDVAEASDTDILKIFGGVRPMRQFLTEAGEDPSGSKSEIVNTFKGWYAQNHA